MWFIFPQMAGLGKSYNSQRFALSGIDEAKAYLAQPLLGARLLECTSCVNRLAERSARSIFGFPDDLKFHSAMTLFDLASDQSAHFSEALRIFFDGKPDQETLRLLTILEPGSSET